jgi:hypothetical protein
MNSSQGSRGDYSDIYESQNNSPEIKTKESTFRSVFHNTVNGRFLDLPPLHERRDYSNELNPSKRQSVNDGFVIPNAKKSNPSQTSINFYKNRNPLPDTTHNSTGISNSCFLQIQTQFESKIAL